MVVLLTFLALAASGTRADADALFKTGHYQEAGEIYLELLRAAPRDPELLDAMGQTLRQMGQFRTAAGFFERELVLNPSDRAATRSLAATFEAGNAPDEARRLLTQLTTSDPADGESWYQRGMLSYRTGYYAAAIDEFDRCLKLSPNGGTQLYRNRAQVTRAISLVETGRLEAARKEVPALIAIPENADNLDLLLAWVRLLYEDGRYADAMTQVERAIAASPQNAAAHFWRARILQQLGENPQAVGEAERARELAPDSPAPRNLLVRLYQKSGRSADAAKEADWLRQHEAQAARP